MPRRCVGQGLVVKSFVVFERIRRRHLGARQEEPGQYTVRCNARPEKTLTEPRTLQRFGHAKDGDRVTKPPGGSLRG